MYVYNIHAVYIEKNHDKKKYEYMAGFSTTLKVIRMRDLRGEILNAIFVFENIQIKIERG